MTKNWVNTLKNAVFGEVVGHSVAIGAVYMPHYMAPDFEQKMTDGIATQLASFKHTDAKSETKNAEILKDDVLMQLAGLSNFGTQLWQHRRGLAPDAQHSWGSDIGRMVSGRVGGTVTSLVGEFAARQFAPHLTESIEENTAGGIHWVSHMIGYNKHQRPSREEKHASDIVFSNTIQTLFALPGNVGMQQLYEKVISDVARVR